MDDDHTEELRQRQLRMESLFSQLPPASSKAYWQQIENTETPIEVLIRCLRAQLAASRQRDASRIEELIVRRVQSTVALWARIVIRNSGALFSSTFDEDIQQQCFATLLLRMRDSSQAYLAIDFTYSLKRLFQNATQLVCEQAGLRTRKGVATPERVPRHQIDSLTRPDDGTELPDPAEMLADPRAERAFELAELIADLAEVVKQLSPRDKNIIYMSYWKDMSQKEIAEQLECTDRTVRYRLAEILPRLRRDYTGDEEDHHV